MITRFIILSFLLALAGPTMADSYVERPTTAYEVLAGSVQLPQRADRKISVNRCETCQPTMLQLTEQTRFVITGQTVSLGEFRDYAKSHLEDALVVIFYRDDFKVAQMVLGGDVAGAPTTNKTSRPRPDAPERREKDQQPQKMRSSR